jgi:hypothetical protein
MATVVIKWLRNARFVVKPAKVKSGMLPTGMLLPRYVALGSEMIGFPSRGIDGWWECPTVIKLDEITQPWTLSSFLSLVEYYSGQYSGQKKLHFGFFYKRLAYGILPTARK